MNAWLGQVQKDFGFLDEEAEFLSHIETLFPKKKGKGKTWKGGGHQ